MDSLATAPILIGVAGGTGSGKTTIARNIVAGLPAGSAETIEHDSYYRHRPELSPLEREKLNYDHPDALESALLAQHLRALKAGRGVDVPIYDFVRHQRCAESRRVEPAPVIVVEGILVFAEEALRRCFDIKVFVDTDADLRVIRRIRRDMEQRGRTFDQVRAQYYTSVRPMHLEFVEPSKRWADIIVPEGGKNEVALDLIVGKLLNVLDR